MEARELRLGNLLFRKQILKCYLKGLWKASLQLISGNTSKARMWLKLTLDQVSLIQSKSGKQ